MPETSYARGEIALLSFATAWVTYCEEHGLAWPAPKIAVEDGVAIARFSEQRVSVRHVGAPLSDYTEGLDWCSAEAEAKWMPVACYELNAVDFCAKLAAVLDRRIPW